MMRRLTMACLFRVFLLLILIVAIGLVELVYRLRSQEESLGATIEQAKKASLDRSYRDTPVKRRRSPYGRIKAYYSHARRDRCGGALQDMLFAHAYSYQRKVEYGGACGTEPRTPEHKQLIEMLGLSNELKFACPPVNNSQAHRILQSEKYYLQDTAVWTPDWLDYIRSKVSYPPRDSTIFQIAVHIRRGDVSLCDPDVNFRYLPNAHYLQLIQKYMPSDKNKKVQVTIFSEAPDDNPLEPWQDFSNFTLSLGTGIPQAWKTLIMVDVLIMSKSSFSMVPAMLNRHGIVVYTPFWHEPLQTWEVVSEAQVEASDTEMKRLQKEKCQ